MTRPRVVLRRAWLRGALLVLAAVTAGASLTGLLIVRAHVAASDRARTHQTIVEVCRRVHRLDLAIQKSVATSSSRKALLQVEYYRTHPAELSLALDHAKAVATILRRADCSPAEIGESSPPTP